MKSLLPGDMIEATRLTRAGRLNEAVALLQNLLRGTRGGNSRNPALRPRRSRFRARVLLTVFSRRMLPPRTSKRRRAR